MGQLIKETGNLSNNSKTTKEFSQGCRERKKHLKRNQLLTAIIFHLQEEEKKN